MESVAESGAMRWLTRAGLALLLACTLLPVLAGLVFAGAYSVGAIGLLSEGLTLQHWREMLADAESWITLAYSLYLALAALALSVALGLALSFLLGERAQRGSLSFLLYAQLAVPPIVAALAAYLLLGNAGVIARAAVHLGIVAPGASFPDLLYGREGLGVIIVHTALVAPFFTLYFRRLAVNEGLPAMCRLAASLGASRWQQWRAVYAPALLTRGLMVISAYGIFLLGAFEVPLLIGARYPAPVSVLIQQQFGELDVAQRPQALALTTLYMLLAGGAVSLWLLRVLRPRRPG